MKDLEIEILSILYENWWYSTTIGYNERGICEKVKADENKVSQTLQFLESQDYIEEDRTRYKITTPSGIEAYEEVLPPLPIAKKETQRKMILQALEKIYEQDIHATTKHDELSKTVRIEDFNELNGQMKYLESKGYIELTSSMGNNFETKLLVGGKLILSSDEPQNSQSMANAYRSLFIVENHIRKFIETKLTEHYDDDWWEKGISKALKDKADKRNSEEREYGWQVSTIKSNLEFLSFQHLSNIITNEWDVFRPVFKDQNKINLRLKELEEIRNAIAHTRTLTDDAMERLELYRNDIYNLVK